MAESNVVGEPTADQVILASGYPTEELANLSAEARAEIAQRYLDDGHLVRRNRLTGELYVSQGADANWYDDAGVASCDQDPVRLRVAEALSLVPLGVAEWAYREVVFVGPEPRGAFCLGRTDRQVIALSWDLLAADRKELCAASILHELGHAKLDHSGIDPETGYLHKGSRQKEVEAWQWVEQWVDARDIAETALSEYPTGQQSRDEGTADGSKMPTRAPRLRGS